MSEYPHYEELIKRESRHWGEVRPDPEHPQLWHDPTLHEIFFGDEYRSFIERIVRKGGAVLELGCGEGNLALELAQRGLTVTAIDLSPERIQRASDAAHTAGVESRITFRVDDLNRSSLPSETYDCVVAHDSLHHILEIERLCGQVWSSLKPGGSLIVMDFLGMGMVRKLAAAFLFALLPTYQPYSTKWNMKRRLPAFVAGERSKRTALKTGSSSPLHPESPFEEISQRSIIEAVAKRLTIIDRHSFAPFFYYLAPKVRLPHAVRYHAARWLKRADDLLLRLHVEGAYFILEARKD